LRDVTAIDSFISRWAASGAAERANYQMLLAELCDLLGVPRPDPTSPDPEKNLYVFDRAITRIAPDGTSVTNYIDFYKSSHFVLETKQGVDALLRSKIALFPKAPASQTKSTPTPAKQPSSASANECESAENH
jgi:hypothetical protein